MAKTEAIAFTVEEVEAMFHLLCDGYHHDEYGLDLVESALETLAFFDKNGVVWIVTYGKGVSSYDGYSWTSFTREDGLGSDYIRAVDASPVGNDVWVTSDNRISCYSGDMWRSFQIDCDGFDSPVSDIAVDRHDLPELLDTDHDGAQARLQIE